MEMSDVNLPFFPTSYSEIIRRVNNIEPEKYGATRNYTNGAVTYLSPYLSRGVISTKFVFSEILKKGFSWSPSIEKFVQELAWRDYWQQVWVTMGDRINFDLKRPQEKVENYLIANAVVNGKTGIQAIDNAILRFYKTGYLHNHLRMYIASISCNVARSHWGIPAKWMYYHLLDADWASNALSWQWIAGTNAQKKYYANQDNINKYSFTKQKGTFLDIPYEAFDTLQVPTHLKELTTLKLVTPLPPKVPIEVDTSLPTYVYNFYNLDPFWKKNTHANRILLLEPSFFDQYPVSKQTIDFVIGLATKNIPNVKIYVGEFESLKATYSLEKIYYKEHPLNKNYIGIEEPRDWIFEVKGYFPSFFKYWKECKKQLVY